MSARRRSRDLLEFSGETDMMNDTVGIDDAGHPLFCHARKARILDRNLRGRTSSGPAAMVPRQKAGPQAAETFRAPEKPLANPGRSLIAFSNRVSFVNGCCSLRVTVLSAVGIIRRNIWSEAQVLQCPLRRRKWPSPSGKRPFQQSGSSINLLTVRITGQCRPDRGTIDKSRAAIIGWPHVHM
jgi:hypothetical protein